MFEAGDSTDATYFPTSAVISIAVALSSGQVVQAAMVGRDGVVGAGAALKRFPPDLNRRDSQRVKDEQIFVH